MIFFLDREELCGMSMYVCVCVCVCVLGGGGCVWPTISNILLLQPLIPRPFIRIASISLQVWDQENRLVCLFLNLEPTQQRTLCKTNTTDSKV